MHYRDRYFMYTKGTKRKGKRGEWYRCEMCGEWFRKDKITVDHIIPMRKGGINCRSNLRGLCRSCNSSKGSRITKKEFWKTVFLITIEGKLFWLIQSMCKRKILDIKGVPYKRET